MIEMSCMIQILCGKLLGMKASNRLNSVANLFKNVIFFFFWEHGYVLKGKLAALNPFSILRYIHVWARE